MKSWKAKLNRTLRQPPRLGAKLGLEVFGQLLSLWLPRCCLVCSRPIRAGNFCSACAPQAPESFSTTRCPICFEPSDLDSEPCLICRYLPLPYQTFRYLWPYSGKVTDAIHAMKYRPSRKLAAWFGAQMAATLTRLYPKQTWDLVLPIPSSLQSLNTRTFNQALVLAKVIVHKLKQNCPQVRLDSWSLVHNGYRATQASLDHNARFSNVRSAFSVRGQKLLGKRLLLVDDVVTTGATTSAATIALLDAGARSVDVLALACSSVYPQFRSVLGKLVRA